MINNHHIAKAFKPICIKDFPWQNGPDLSVHRGTDFNPILSPLLELADHTSSNGGKELPFRRIGFDGFIRQKTFLSFQSFDERLKLISPTFQFTDEFLSDGFLALNGFQQSPLRPPRPVSLLPFFLYFRDAS